MYIKCSLAAVLSALVVTSAADTPTYAISAHIVSSGSSVHSAGVCFGMDAVVAEPVAGFSSGGAYGLSAGFFYAAPIVSDTLFANGFEDCSP